MNKNQNTSQENIWDDTESNSTQSEKIAVPKGTTAAQARKQAQAHIENSGADSVTVVIDSRDFDLEGLMTDFPTAKELERFVYDETGIVLNLKGRANKLKYQVAMDVLNGAPVDQKFIGTENPYLEKTDLVPEDPIRELPPRDPAIPGRDQLQNEFFTAFVPHSDAEYHAQGRKMHCTFKKYKNGMITYEVIGPIEPRPYGEKIDKWGKVRPEIIRWVDPRTGEQIVQRPDGTFTPIGRRLKAMMQTFRYNNSNQWITYVDRDFVSLDQKAAVNPWDLEA
jgi:hypothetical protein